MEKISKLVRKYYYSLMKEKELKESDPVLLELVKAPYPVAEEQLEISCAR